MIKTEQLSEVKVPDSSLRIWRYLSFPRFKQLMEEKCIYLARIDQFSDFNEGRISRKSSAESRDELAAQGDDGYVANALESMLSRMSTNTSYAVCWNASDRESNLMWRAYGQIPRETQTDYAFKVAISTTAERLLKSLDASSNEREDKYYLGMVKYLDYENEHTPNDVVEKCFAKQLEYASETECRFVVNRMSNFPGGTLASMPAVNVGMLMSVNLDYLVEAVYIEPVLVDQVRLGISGTKGQDQEYAQEVSKIMEKRLTLVSDIVSAQISDCQKILNEGIRISRVL